MMKTRDMWIKEKWYKRDCKKALNRFLKIGFKLDKDYINSGDNHVQEYKYRPPYMKDTHYTLILFRGDDFRLYVHRNEDGKYVDSIFQISLYQEGQIKFINDGLDKEFVKEMREEKIGSLLS